MNKQISLCGVFLCCFCCSQANALDVSGRIASSTNISQTESGQLGYSASGDSQQTINTNQQSFRLMLQESEQDFVDGFSWVLHGKFYRQNVSALSSAGMNVSENFRYQEFSNTHELSQSGNDEAHYIYELDIASVQYSYKKMDLTLGRQAIDWGVGRFWQPMNVFGAFAPTDLDTDYKAGIDSAKFSYYPSAFSSFDVVAVWSPEDNSDYDESFAAYYRSQLAEVAEITLLLAKVLNNEVHGLSLEGEWRGMGLRAEAVRYQLIAADKIFWIAGIDYQFQNGTLLLLEYYHNAMGVSDESDLVTQLTNPLIANGLQAYMGKEVLGLSLNKDLSPLWNANYSVLAAQLLDMNQDKHSSILHQLSLRYSLQDNSELLFSALGAQGKKLNVIDVPQSEFGHVPDSFSIRLLYYF